MIDSPVVAHGPARMARHTKMNLPAMTLAVVAGFVLSGTACQKSSAVKVDVGADAGKGADAGAGQDSQGDSLGTQDATLGEDGSTSSAVDGGTGVVDGAAISVSLSEASFTLETPDVSHALTATVSGTATTTVTWTSSNTYIATVSTTGVVRSVSGGEATITATSTATSTSDVKASATCKVTVAEPSRTKAAVYVDAKTVTSGSVNFIMVGDSLMRTYVANAADQSGWGQVFGEFFTKDVTVDNTLANGGRSSRSFYNEIGRWDQAKVRLMAAKTAGVPTFVFIMFAHNDQKKTTDTLGADYLTFARNNANGTVAGTFYDYLERYIVETRELGGIPVLLTPFVREYLQGTPSTITTVGLHNITAPYAGETTARGDYPAAMKEIAAKHDVPLVDITTWSKGMVEAHAAANTLPFIYISGDQTHIRNRGALLMAEEVARSLKAQGILANHVKASTPHLMLDASTLAFGGIFTGNALDKSFMLSGFGDVSGTITITAPAGYSVSTNGTDFAASATVVAGPTYTGTVVSVRFTPTDAVTYNSDLTIKHSTLTPDYGNSAANATPGIVSLTGNGKVAIAGSPATATWPMFSGTTIVNEPSTMGAITATSATLVGLVGKNVNYGAARFDTPDGAWPAEAARNAARYAEFTVPVTSGTFVLDTVSVGAGSGGGSNMRWDIVYSLTSDFSSPTALATALSGAKDTVVTSNFASLGLSVAAGQTLYLRVYPYNSSAAASGKTIMLANVVISGVTN